MADCFGASIAEIRKRKCLAQKVVAIEAGLDPSYLAGLENGRRPLPRKHMLSRILSALDADSLEEQTVHRALAVTRVIRVLSDTEPAFAKALTGLMGGLLYCSPEEVRAIETIAMGIKRREKNRMGEKPI